MNLLKIFMLSLVLLVRLCTDEVVKGNKPTGSLSTNGFKNVGDMLNPRFDVNYQREQVKITGIQ